MFNCGKFRKCFHSFKGHPNQNGKAENLPKVVGRLVQIACNFFQTQLKIAKFVKNL